jgi:hypothetical protein
MQQSNREIPFNSSTLETVDQSLFDWVNNDLNLYATTNEGWKKVPVIWMTAERSYQVKHDKSLRDLNGTFILPVITIQRTSVNKNLDEKSNYWAAIPSIRQHPGDPAGGVLEIHRQISQEKTSNFANADAKRKYGQNNFPTDNKKVVYESRTIPLPIYVECEYDITIHTEYQQQMNDLIQPFLTIPGGVNHLYLQNAGHKYEAFIEGDIQLDNNLEDLSEDERKFETTINMRVLGYLVGQGKNAKQPSVSVRENQVEIKISRERVMVGDEMNRLVKKW